MRRMNYNPFEKPFASGEYDVNNKLFLLDKKLDEGFYLLVIYSFDNDEFLSTIISITTGEGVYSYTSPYIKSRYVQNGITINILETGTNIVYIFHDNDLNPILSEGSTISVYKLNQ